MRAREARSQDGEVDRKANRRLMMMLRVVNSLGPLFSSSNNMERRMGKRVGCMTESCCRARDVVQRAFKHRRIS